MILRTMNPSRWHADDAFEGTSDSSPAASIDPIEYGRGQLAALSCRSTNSAREVHVLRLRNAFERAGIATKLRYALMVMNLMREAQELERGFWFPTPLRIVPIDAQTIIVGVVPTNELQRHFHRVTRAGYSRVLPQEDAEPLPHQELDNWLGLKIRDSVAWSEMQIEEAQASMGPTIHSGNAQFFTVTTKRSSLGTITYPRWADTPSFSLAATHGVVLCRERIGRESFRHFLGRVKAERLVAESLRPRDPVRIQFGLAALAGKPITVSVITHGGNSTFHIPTNLPRAEHQLLVALGNREMSSTGKAYRVPDGSFVELIAARLRGLGCEVRLSRV